MVWGFLFVFGWFFLQLCRVYVCLFCGFRVFLLQLWPGCFGSHPFLRGAKKRKYTRSAQTCNDMGMQTALLAKEPQTTSPAAPCPQQAELCPCSMRAPAPSPRHGGLLAHSPTRGLSIPKPQLRAAPTSLYGPEFASPRVQLFRLRGCRAPRAGGPPRVPFLHQRQTKLCRAARSPAETQNHLSCLLLSPAAIQPFQGALQSRRPPLLLLNQSGECGQEAPGPPELRTEVTPQHGATPQPGGETGQGPYVGSTTRSPPGRVISARFPLGSQWEGPW